MTVISWGEYFRRNIEGCLADAKKELDKLEEGRHVVSEGSAFGAVESDVEIAADVFLGEFICDRLSEDKAIARITVEGAVGDKLFPNGWAWVTVDPLDGSLNYFSSGDSLGLPYSACITVLSRQPEGGAAFNDVLAAGVIDLRGGDLWSASWHNGEYRTYFNGRRTRTQDVRDLDLGRMIVVGEMYYPENRDKLAKAFAGTKGWLRNPGSAAYEMALIASGTAAAYICDRQKQHELGAAFALVKGAGGVALTSGKQDLGQVPYDFRTQTPVVLAANEHIANQLFERFSRAGVSF